LSPGPRSPVAAATPVARGYTNNSRWLVTLAGEGTAFVKQAVDEPTAAWLRQEHAHRRVMGGLASGSGAADRRATDVDASDLETAASA
jgi:hypothetical protein